MQKTIQEFKNAQEESVKVLYNANKKIKEYEDQLNIEGTKPSKPDSETEKTNTPGKTKKPLPKETAPKKIEEKSQGFNDLPSGSNRKQLPNI